MRTSRWSSLLSVCLFVALAREAMPFTQLTAAGGRGGQWKHLSPPQEGSPPLPGHTCGHGQHLRERHKESRTMCGTVARLKPVSKHKQNVLIYKIGSVLS